MHGMRHCPPRPGGQGARKRGTARKGRGGGGKAGCGMHPNKDLAVFVVSKRLFIDLKVVKCRAQQPNRLPWPLGPLHLRQRGLGRPRHLRHPAAEEAPRDAIPHRPAAGFVWAVQIRLCSVRGRLFVPGQVRECPESRF